MAWTAHQIKTHAMACRAAGMSDEHRKLLLRQFTAEGSSKARELSNADFEQFMAIVERSAGGQVLSFSVGYWQKQADDGMTRTRHLIRQLDQYLLDQGIHHAGSLAAQVERMTKTKTDLDACEGQELHKVLNALRSMARRHGLDVIKT